MLLLQCHFTCIAVGSTDGCFVYPALIYTLHMRFTSILSGVLSNIQEALSTIYKNCGMLHSVMDNNLNIFTQLYKGQQTKIIRTSIKVDIIWALPSCIIFGYSTESECR